MALVNFSTATRFDFVGWRRVSLYVFCTLFVLTAGSYIVRGLNYGIDFHGGIIFELRMKDPVDLSQLRADIDPLVKDDVMFQLFGDPHEVLIRIEDASSGQNPIYTKQIVEDVKKKLGPEVEYRRIETIGPKIGGELISNGLKAIGLALLGMLIYVWFRFEWQFGACALLSLLHNFLALLSLFILFQLEFNETSIVALLITAAYSINDAVVVFDRVRENRRSYFAQSLEKLINLSLNETLSRTLLNSSSTLLALITLYLFGGKIISAFSFPIIVGILISTYTSLFFTTPLLVYFLQNKNGSPKNPSVSCYKES